MLAMLAVREKSEYQFLRPSVFVIDLTHGSVATTMLQLLAVNA